MKYSLSTSVVTGAVFGALVFVISFVGGSAITAAFGPGTSGVITVLFTTLVVVCAGMLVPRFPTLLVTNIVFSLLAVPTTLFGPFGVTKILFGLATGSIYEIVVFLLRRNSVGYLAAAAIAAFSSVYLIYFGSLLQGISPSTTLEKYLHYFAIVYGALAAIGAWFGVLSYRRIEHTNIVERLQGTGTPPAESGNN